MGYNDFYERILNDKGKSQEWRIQIYMRIKSITLELEAATLLLAVEQKEINGGTYKNAIDYVEKAKLLIDELIDTENPKKKLTYMGVTLQCPKCGSTKFKAEFNDNYVVCKNCGKIPSKDLIPHKP